MKAPGARIKRPSLLGVLLIGALLASALPAAAASQFAGWAAVVVAGDFKAAHSDSPTEAFDNARRDVTHALVSAGFDPKNIQAFSARPQNYPSEHLLPSDSGLIDNSLAQLARQAQDGCLIYFSSHGNQDGIQVGETLFSPAGLSKMVDLACGSRPTVVILSACFSGVFIPALLDANRAVFTAARNDRSSFGCGVTDKYPYYDDCILSSFPTSADFVALANSAKACVAVREIATGAKPPSEPQIAVGPGLRPTLPFYTFNK